MATVLIADDEEAIRDAFGKLLTELGYHVLGAVKDGREAIAFCQSGPPDLILMDNVMPRMYGVEATAEIVKRFPATKVLICSGWPSREAIEDSIFAGAKGFVQKPFQWRTLHDAMERILGGGEFFPSRNPQDEAAPAVRLEQFLRDLLSERELYVLVLMGQARTDEEIAEKFGATIDSIQEIRQNIREKLGGKRAPDLAELGRALQNEHV